MKTVTTILPDNAIEHILDALSVYEYEGCGNPETYAWLERILNNAVTVTIEFEDKE